MDFRDSLSAEMPAPRDDEPAGLRRDILDELADHLACSYNRELLRGANPGEARRRAIERFGDPAAVARRLWLDAMRGKIMGQRVLIATCLLVMAACLGLMGLVWVQSNRAAAEAAVANRRLAEVVAQAQASNEEMLRQLRAMAKESDSSKSDIWVPLKFKLTLEKPDGPPAVGYRIHLGRGLGGASGQGVMLRSTDSAGLADFGVVQPGDWEFQIDGFPWQTTASLNVLPGTPVVRSIVCPESGSASIRVRVGWPKTLRDRDLRAVAVFRHNSARYEPDPTWEPVQARFIQLLCNSRGEVFTPRRSIDLVSRATFGAPKKGAAEPMAQGQILAVLDSESSVPVNGPPSVPAGPYELDRLMLFRPVKGAPGRPDVLVLTSLMDREGGEEAPPGLVGVPSAMNTQPMFMQSEIRVRAVPFPPAYLKGLGRFEARPARVAEWEIPLPDEMIRAIESFPQKAIEDVEKWLKVEPPSPFGEVQ